MMRYGTGSRIFILTKGSRCGPRAKAEAQRFWHLLWWGIGSADGKVTRVCGLTKADLHASASKIIPVLFLTNG